MFSFVPDAERLSQIFSQAIAPTFFLGAVAAFVSLMASRLSAIVARLQTLNAITDDEHGRIHLKADIELLRRRASLLNSGILASLRGGLCATVSTSTTAVQMPVANMSIGVSTPSFTLIPG